MKKIVFLLFCFFIPIVSLGLEKYEEGYINKKGVNISISQYQNLKDLNFDDRVIENMTLDEIESFEGAILVGTTSRLARVVNSEQTGYKLLALNVVKQTSGNYYVLASVYWNQKDPANNAIDAMVVSYPISGVANNYFVHVEGDYLTQTYTMYEDSSVSSQLWNRYIDVKFNQGGTDSIASFDIGLSAAAIPLSSSRSKTYAYYTMYISGISAGQKVCNTYKHNEQWVSSNTNYEYLDIIGQGSANSHTINLGNLTSSYTLYNTYFSSQQVCVTLDQ